MKFNLWDITLNINVITKSDNRPSYELVSAAFKKAIKESFTEDILISEVEMRTKPIQLQEVLK